MRDEGWDPLLAAYIRLRGCRKGPWQEGNHKKRKEAFFPCGLRAFVVQSFYVFATDSETGISTVVGIFYFCATPGETTKNLVSD